jgi:tripartite-type tricarboxylate transporter receptor subunit TctC
MRRREFIAGLVSAAAWPASAGAQTYPMRPLRFIVGYPAGGGADIQGRGSSRTLQRGRSETSIRALGWSELGHQK